MKQEMTLKIQQWNQGNRKNKVSQQSYQWQQE